MAASAGTTTSHAGFPLSAPHARRSQLPVGSFTLTRAGSIRLAARHYKHSITSRERLQLDRRLVAQRATGRTGAKELLGLLQRRDEGVDFVARVVEVETGAGGRGDAEFLVQRHRAKVTGANSDTFLVEVRCQIVRMNVAEREGDEPASLLNIERAIDFDFDEFVEA